MEALITELHSTIDGRPRPETVASLIGRVLQGELSDDERRILGQAARHDERGPFYGSLMATDWERPVGAGAQLKTLGELFDTDVTWVNPDDPAQIRAALTTLGAPLGWAPGVAVPARSAKHDGVGRRALTRRWRYLSYTHDKAVRMERMQLRRRFAQVGRIGFAGDITATEIAASPSTGAYVAYVAAKANVRREFTLSGRDSNIDQVAKMLRERLETRDDTDWWMVARVTPTRDVLDRLTDTQRGQLLGAWFTEMRVAADLLGELDADEPVNRETMIVSRGCDSDTWNLAAGAYNRARAAWISTLSAAGTFELLDSICPPKAMKVMAGDLAGWHASQGGSIAHPDVRVAAQLPTVWDVLNGVPCDRITVDAACAAVGVDAQKTGWVGPYQRRDTATFRPTPELVHGITIADPLLAAVLRRGGAFSGGPVSDEVYEVLDGLGEIGGHRKS